MLQRALQRRRTWPGSLLRGGMVRLMSCCRAVDKEQCFYMLRKPERSGKSSWAGCLPLAFQKQWAVYSPSRHSSSFLQCQFVCVVSCLLTSALSQWLWKMGAESRFSGNMGSPPDVRHMHDAWHMWAHCYDVLYHLTLFFYLSISISISVSFFCFSFGVTCEGILWRSPCGFEPGTAESVLAWITGTEELAAMHMVPFLDLSQL